MLTDLQESSLTSAGDCFEHWHSADRIPTHDTAMRLIELESAVQVGAGTTVIRPGTDYVLVDTTSGAATIVIPEASRKIAVTVVKLTAANTVTVQAAVGDINGAATYVLSAAHASAKFKAIDGNYYKVA